VPKLRRSGALTYPEPLGTPRPVAGNIYFTLLYFTYISNYLLSILFRALLSIINILRGAKDAEKYDVCYNIWCSMMSVITFGAVDFVLALKECELKLHLQSQRT
jgi:hypothetical protein